MSSSSHGGNASPQYSAELAFALTLADRADAISLSRYQALDLEITTKPENTPVTDADKSVEVAITAAINLKYPSDGIVGEEFGTRTVEQISMGSIGAAYSSPSYLNFINPASLSELRLATYVFGVLNNDLTISDADVNQSTNSTSLSYFSIAFPLSKKMAVVFGMQPTSSVGYSLINFSNSKFFIIKYNKKNPNNKIIL